MSARSVIAHVLAVHYSDSPNPSLVTELMGNSDAETLTDIRQQMRALHFPFMDSDHCYQDGEPCPCTSLKIVGYDNG